jgi:hypothetical protein
MVEFRLVSGGIQTGDAVRPIRPKFYSYNDVVTDDDVTRLIHATDASSTEVYQFQASGDAAFKCSGPEWSSRILAEVWHETLPHHSREIAPQIGTDDPTIPGYANLVPGDD